jgi:hypothetical protein
MSTPTSQAKLQEVMNAAAPHEVLRLARMVRSTYVKKVGNTEVVLDPDALRRLDKCIAQLEGQAH